MKDPFFPTVSEDVYNDSLDGKPASENTSVLQTQPSNRDQSVRLDTGSALTILNDVAVKPRNGVTTSGQSLKLVPISEAFPGQPFPLLPAPVITSTEMTLDQFYKLFEKTPFDAVEILKVLDSTRIQLNIASAEYNVVTKGFHSMHKQLLSYYLGQARARGLKALVAAFNTTTKKVS